MVVAPHLQAKPPSSSRSRPSSSQTRPRIFGRPRMASPSAGRPLSPARMMEQALKDTVTCGHDEAGAQGAGWLPLSFAGRPCLQSARSSRHARDLVMRVQPKQLHLFTSLAMCKHDGAFVGCFGVWRAGTYHKAFGFCHQPRGIQLQPYFTGMHEADLCTSLFQWICIEHPKDWGLRTFQNTSYPSFRTIPFFGAHASNDVAHVFLPCRMTPCSAPLMRTWASLVLVQLPASAPPSTSRVMDAWTLASAGTSLQGVGCVSMAW
eukprot:1144026-Pelagomonas_calceolata.AAC.1